MTKTQYFRPFLLLVSISLLLVYCKQEDKALKKIEQRHAEIMIIHDEVMPKMSDIYKLKKALKEIEQTEASLKLIKELEDADEAMMSWMHQYKKPTPGTKGLDNYLNDQEVLIKEVRSKMLTAIEKAKDAI